jgi:hypothetical protein
MPGRPAAALAGVVAAALLATAACSGSSTPDQRRSSSPSRSATGSPSATASPTATAVRPGQTVWLCRPDRRPDPCLYGQAATAVLPDGSFRPEPVPPRRPRADCCYVYPTVSREPSRNADLAVQTAEQDAARAQASRFSSVCHVWAPIYRQRTVGDLFNPADRAADSEANLIAFRSLRSAWHDYLAHHNHGHPVVVIGHSQGAAMLIRLLHTEVDRRPAERRLLALAILLGGNMTVASGRTIGGSFDHLPLCTRPAQPRCVIAYSSFPSKPPDGAFFGRPGGGVSSFSGETRTAGRQVACVNPAHIGGGRAPLHPYFPSAAIGNGVATPWVTYPGRYAAACHHRDGATWLGIKAIGGARSDDPPLGDQLGTGWGYHVVDVTVALGDLVRDVRAAVRSFRHQPHRAATQ